MSEITLKINTEKAIEDLEVIKSKIKEVAELAEKKEVHLDLNLEVNFDDVRALKKENAELKRKLEGRQKSVNITLNCDIPKEELAKIVNSEAELIFQKLINKQKTKIMRHIPENQKATGFNIGEGYEIIDSETADDTL